MTRTRSAAAVAVSCLLLGGLAAPARAQVTTSDTDDQELRPPRPRFGAVFAQMSFSGVFDTNIDHDEDELESYGGVASARVGVRGGPTSVEYRLGFNRHTNSARWNRTTHRVVARFTERLASDWTLNAYGDVALQHTSEDREVGNYYTVQPRIDYQIDGRRRLRARLRYRFKRIEEQPASNATRSEGRRDDVRIGFELRQLTYPERFVSSATAEARRADDRWASTVSWTRALGSQVEWRIDYELERRLSNEPGRSFTAHRLGWTVSWAAGR
jgi:hypothetical protein